MGEATGGHLFPKGKNVKLFFLGLAGFVSAAVLSAAVISSTKYAVPTWSNYAQSKNMPEVSP